MHKNLITLLVALAVCAAVVRAQSTSFTYQGVLKDQLGQPLPQRNQTVTFKLYTTPLGSEFLWGRTYAVLLDTNGLFNVELSDESGSTVEGGTHPVLKNALAVAADATLYIGLTVNGMGGEIQPRQKILPVPYAVMAADVRNATANLAVAGRVTAADATVNNGLTVKGTTSLKTLTVSGTSDLTGKLTARGGINMTGGEANIGGNLKLSGQVVGNFNVGGKVKENGNDLLSKGVIVMWSGSASQIPAGWALCDGNSGRPDLRGRFIVGVGRGYSVGQTGGEAVHTLTLEEIPAHSHSTSIGTVGYKAAYNSSQEALSGGTENNGNKSFSTNNQGGGKPHENRPPFYALCFIIKL
jgi:microcystin-dependent protein